MLNAEPMVVFVPGAWHTPEHYEGLLSGLEEAGYSTKSLQLPSVDSATPKEATIAGDVAAVRGGLLLPLLDEGKDVVLMAHCGTGVFPIPYGGAVAGAAAYGLGKGDRVTGGSIIRLIWIASFMLPAGTSMMSGTTGKFPPWARADEETGQVEMLSPGPLLFNDVPEPYLSQAISALRPQSISSFFSPVQFAGWADHAYNRRRAYIRTLEKDKTIPTAVQTHIAEKSGAEWTVIDIDADHSPFLSRPQELVAMCVDLIEDFVRK